MKPGKILSFAFAAGVLAQQAGATDGYAVAQLNRWSNNFALAPEMPLYAYIDSHYNPGYAIVKFTIRDNKVVACDTIYDSTVAAFPNFNLDGDKIAFVRYGARIVNGTLQNYNPCAFHIAVMNSDGSNVKDLAVCDRSTLLDWARVDGVDWIYYIPDGGATGGIVRKVKWNDPLSDTVAYNYRNAKVDGWWRWTISANASKAMINLHFTDGSYGNYPHTLPFTSPPLPANEGGTAAASMGSCNGAISPGGVFIAGFVAHAGSTIQHWIPPATYPWGQYTNIYLSLNEISDSLGFYVGNAMEMHRWSVNSDKWMCLSATGGFMARWEGGNQVLSNWVDKKFIQTTHFTLCKSTDATCILLQYSLLGDLWIAGGPKGCYEDSSGKWISVATGQPVSVGPGKSIAQGPAAEGFRIEGRRLRYSSPAAIQSVTCWDLRGRTVFRAGYCGQNAAIPLSRRGSESIVVRIETERGIIVRRISPEVN